MSARSRATVLIIDDEPMVVRVLARTIGSRYDILVAPSGAEAIAMIGEQPSVDAIICDVMMPDMTGLEFYEELRQRVPELSDRILFMTGGVLSEDIRTFLRTAPHGYIEKPFDVPHLCRRLDEIISL